MQRKKPNYGPSNILPNEIDISEEIKKESSRSLLYKGKCRNFSVCVKVPQNQSLSPEELLSFKNEVAVSSQYYHPNICLFLGACEEPGNIKIVTELMEGSLDDILFNQTNYSLSTRIKWAKDAALGITWLHGNNQPVILRELKTSNILYDNSSHMRFKVSGFFGSSQFRKINENNGYSLRSKVYLAPEILLGGTVTEKADVYSFGIVLFEILTRQRFLPNLKSEEELLAVISTSGKLALDIPSDCPNSLKDLIFGCTNIEAKQRPCFNLIVDRLDFIIDEISRSEVDNEINNHIHDINGREFWKRFFLNNTQPLWSEFIQSFYQFISLPLPHDPFDCLLPENPSSDEIQLATPQQLDEFAARNQNCANVVKQELSNRKAGGYLQHNRKISADLRKLLCVKSLLKQSNSTVSLDEFGKVLSWFGPLEVPYVDNGILHRIEEILSYPWFHGNISSQLSEKLLGSKNRKMGDFLVRFSTRTPGSFCISRLSDKTIQHTVIGYKAGVGYSLKGKSYPTLPALIQENKQVLTLKNFCPGSKFLWLFDDGFDDDDMDFA